MTKLTIVYQRAVSGRYIACRIARSGSSSPVGEEARREEHEAYRGWSKPAPTIGTQAWTAMRLRSPTSSFSASRRRALRREHSVMRWPGARAPGHEARRRPARSTGPAGQAS